VTRIYLDNHATTPTDPRVADAVYRSMVGTFGNPRSADHTFGDEAQALVDQAAADLAALCDCDPDEVHFNSGATEAIRQAIAIATSYALAERRRPARIVALPIEHRAVLTTIDEAVKNGRATVDWLGVDRMGRLDLASLERAFSKPADLAVCMAANNELGNVYPVGLVAARARRAGASTFTDLSQAVGKVPLSVRDLDADLVALSGHKIYGPKGAGAIVVRGRYRGAKLPDGGTPNVPGIVGLGEAARYRRQEMLADETRIADLRDRLERVLLSSGVGVVVNGNPEARLAGSLHVSAVGAQNRDIIDLLRDRVAVSTGAACATAQGMSSHVMRAMGLPPEVQQGALRIGLGKFTTRDEVDQGAAAIVDAIRRVRMRRSPSAA